MESRVVIGALVAAVMAVMSWMANTTLELKLAVQRLEIILLDDAMKK
mgnify:CR=1 FL=1